ncbi:glutamate synthase domain 2 [Moorella thermoacetica Y72]|uniref:Glutamate synthase domain 2 n=1 Tax=Moorella thermoacetica Y72 TaxID=1325331 RepID=A0A0S6U8S5_NEOTH|nr:glutamate synthase domain 2 [Moorella thermoacetica Y72]
MAAITENYFDPPATLIEGLPDKLAAVYMNYVASNIVSCGRSKVDDRTNHIFRLPGSAQWNCLKECLKFFRPGDLFVERSINRTRRYGVNRNTFISKCFC